MIYTEADFGRFSWHDCHIWGIELRAGDPDDGDWTSDLVLDIDFIVEWICGTGGGGQFRVAPATLVFHGVTDPKIAIDLGTFRFSSRAASRVDRHCRARRDAKQKGLPRPPLLQLEDPPELARLKRDRFRCARLHTDTACRPRLNREAMSIARHEEPPIKPMKLRVAFGAESLSANR